MYNGYNSNDGEQSFCIWSRWQGFLMCHNFSDSWHYESIMANILLTFTVTLAVTRCVLIRVFQDLVMQI
jgi:hypothetical protein